MVVDRKEGESLYGGRRHHGAGQVPVVKVVGYMGFAARSFHLLLPMWTGSSPRLWMKHVYALQALGGPGSARHAMVYKARSDSASQLLLTAFRIQTLIVSHCLAVAIVRRHDFQKIEEGRGQRDHHLEVYVRRPHMFAPPASPIMFAEDMYLKQKRGRGKNMYMGYVRAHMFGVAPHICSRPPPAKICSDRSQSEAKACQSAGGGLAGTAKCARYGLGSYAVKCESHCSARNKCEISSKRNYILTYAHMRTHMQRFE